MCCFNWYNMYIQFFHNAGNLFFTSLQCFLCVHSTKEGKEEMFLIWNYSSSQRNIQKESVIEKTSRNNGGGECFTPVNTNNRLREPAPPATTRGGHYPIPAHTLSQSHKHTHSHICHPLVWLHTFPLCAFSWVFVSLVTNEGHKVRTQRWLGGSLR